MSGLGVVFTDNSAAVIAAMEMKKRQALEAVGAAAEGHAKVITPVDTGRLQGSIGHVPLDDAAYIGTNVEYAPYVEFGTYRTKAHHMLKRAVSEHVSEYVAIIRAAMR